MHKSINNLIEIKSKLKTISKKKHSLPNIIAVSKTFPIDKIFPLIEYGHIHFGENKIQEANYKWPKIKEKYPNIKLHMLGKVQSNKVKFLLPLFDYIHSLDNLKLAKLISNMQVKYKFKPKIFIQVNVGNESQKSGIAENELEYFYKKCTLDLNLDIIGLMCIPPVDGNTKNFFLLLKNCSDKLGLENLSMGMSHDYLEAAMCGSTFIRIGTAIFGTRN